ncbi:hypothetical protein B0H16DRAFT_1698897 [Mycena metata]|uniref:Uncharacterized protein n=1 Tax=Mycena metata TaxID=1033252 RepID=A0AAD7MM01_9AGAR|nr:hypothetical protein B0H16DRAFT_1698897 [Mycena metata]
MDGWDGWMGICVLLLGSTAPSPDESQRTQRGGRRGDSRETILLPACTGVTNYLDENGKNFREEKGRRAGAREKKNFTYSLSQDGLESEEAEHARGCRLLRDRDAECWQDDVERTQRRPITSSGNIFRVDEHPQGCIGSCRRQADMRTSVIVHQNVAIRSHAQQPRLLTGREGVRLTGWLGVTQTPEVLTSLDCESTLGDLSARRGSPRIHQGEDSNWILPVATAGRRVLSWNLEQTWNLKAEDAAIAVGAQKLRIAEPSQRKTPLWRRKERLINTGGKRLIHNWPFGGTETLRDIAVAVQERALPLNVLGCVDRSLPFYAVDRGSFCLDWAVARYLDGHGRRFTARRFGFFSSDGTGRSTGRPSRPWQRVNHINIVWVFCLKEIRNIRLFLKRNEGFEPKILTYTRVPLACRYGPSFNGPFLDAQNLRRNERARHPSNGCRRTVATATGGTPTNWMIPSAPRNDFKFPSLRPGSGTRPSKWRLSFPTVQIMFRKGSVADIPHPCSVYALCRGILTGEACSNQVRAMGGTGQPSYGRSQENTLCIDLK